MLTRRRSGLLVYSTVLAVDTASFDSGAIIPPGWRELKIALTARTDEVAVTSTVLVSFNGDAAADYYQEVAGAVSNALGAGAGNLNGVGASAAVAADNLTPLFSPLEITCFDYAGGSRKCGLLRQGVSGAVAADTRIWDGVWDWTAVAPITRVTVAITSGAGQKFRAGSSFQVMVAG